MLSYWQNNVSEKFLPPINYKKKLESDGTRSRRSGAKIQQTR